MTAIKKETVLCISDLHAPYHNNNALDFLNDLNKHYKPSKIVCLGDEIDNHAISFHDKIPELYSAGHEFEAALVFLKQLYKLFPKAQVCTSNHTSRFYRVAQKAGLPSRAILDYRKLLEAPRDWSWHDRIVIDNVCYEHGEGVSGRNGAWKAMTENKMSTVIGHLHSYAAVQYSNGPFSTTFAMNVGCLIDTQSLAFAYGNKYRNKATLGAGMVFDGIHAQFIPMLK